MLNIPSSVWGWSQRNVDLKKKPQTLSGACGLWLLRLIRWNRYGIPNTPGLAHPDTPACHTTDLIRIVVQDLVYFTATDVNMGWIPLRLIESLRYHNRRTITSPSGPACLV